MQEISEVREIFGMQSCLSYTGPGSSPRSFGTTRHQKAAWLDPYIQQGIAGKRFCTVKKRMYFSSRFCHYPCG
jgi:hypothetical protein